MTTSFEDRVAILSDFWLNYRHDEEFTDLIEYADLGLPLAFAADQNIIGLTVEAKLFIDEAFELLLAVFEMEDDGFEALDDILQT